MYSTHLDQLDCGFVRQILFVLDFRCNQRCNYQMHLSVLNSKLYLLMGFKMSCMIDLNF